MQHKMQCAAYWSHKLNQSLLIVTHGLISNQDGLTLHPDLFLWQSPLSKRKQQWFQTSSYNPLALYAAILDVEPALLLSSKLPKNTAKQYWVASPYHAQLSRDAVRVMPEGMMPWCDADAIWACELLNPLLAEEDMQLYAIGSALLLACDKPLHAELAVFADIAGKNLPNRHPEGVDGGHVMRLMSEVQMMFKQSVAPHRRNRGEMDVHGLWFWGACESCDLESLSVKAIASRDSFLRAVVDGKDANIIITEPEQLSELIQQGNDLPKNIVLFGGEHAVLLKKAILPKFSKRNWLPKAVKNQSELLLLLRKF